MNEKMSPGQSSVTTEDGRHERLLEFLRLPVATAIIASVFVNVLYLASPLFMLQVYDRVLSSKSISTLVSLLIITGVVLLFWGALDGARRLIIIQVTKYTDSAYSSEVAEAALFLDPDGQGRRIRDLDVLRGFFMSGLPPSLMDAVFSPVLIAVVFLLHPLLGVAALAGAAINLIIMLTSARRGQGTSEKLTKSHLQRSAWEEIGKRNRAWLVALGMNEAVLERWKYHNAEVLNEQGNASSRSARYGSAARAVRLIEQALILAVGAYLVLAREATPGVMVAASLLSARALAPIDQVVSGWPSIVSARAAYRSLCSMKFTGGGAALLALPAPSESVRVAHVHYVRPGSKDLVLADITFRLAAGEAIGIIGPSGSGKSTIGKIIVGALSANRGDVRFDEALIDHWPALERSRWIGYMPQEVSLLPGTVAQNICRFRGDADGLVVAAAKAAGAHEMIVGLSDGYNTVISSDGGGLSGGERQRIGLARALYGAPFVLVLDEPSASLDSIGERALNDAVADVKSRGGIAVIMTHRPSTLSSVDYVLVLQSGKQLSFGKKEAVLSNLVSIRKVGSETA